MYVYCSVDRNSSRQMISRPKYLLGFLCQSYPKKISHRYLSNIIKISKNRVKSQPRIGKRKAHLISSRLLYCFDFFIQKLEVFMFYVRFINNVLWRYIPFWLPDPIIWPSFLNIHARTYARTPWSFSSKDWAGLRRLWRTWEFGLSERGGPRKWELTFLGCMLSMLSMLAVADMHISCTTFYINSSNKGEYHQGFRQN